MVSFFIGGNKMVWERIARLKSEKQNAIEWALLKEFTLHPVAEAQVARIVKVAGISRGAFYNYFKDLPDAYRYIYKIAIRNIHQNLHTKDLANARDFVQQTREFVKGAENSDYYQLMQMHYLHNESYVSRLVLPIEANSELQWARITLVHDTLRGALVQPETAEKRFQQLAWALKQLEG